MKKLLFFLLLSIPASAQDSVSVKKHSKFQIGLSMMPEMDLIDFDESFSRKEPTLNHNIGANLNYRINQKFSIETGLQYYNSRAKYEKEFSENGEPYILTIKGSKKSIRTPLKLNLILGKRKLRFIASAGVFLHFWINSVNETTKYYAEKTEHEKTITSLNTFRELFPSPMMSLGVDYKLNNKINIRIEPTIWRPNLDIGSFLHDYTTGINFGTYYKL